MMSMQRLQEGRLGSQVSFHIHHSLCVTLPSCPHSFMPSLPLSSCGSCFWALWKCQHFKVGVFFLRYSVSLHIFFQFFNFLMSLLTISIILCSPLISQIESHLICFSTHFLLIINHMFPLLAYSIVTFFYFYTLYIKDHVPLI